MVSPLSCDALENMAAVPRPRFPPGPGDCCQGVKQTFEAPSARVEEVEVSLE